jgi:polyhydroxybutyrate depolymerase
MKLLHVVWAAPLFVAVAWFCGIAARQPSDDFEGKLEVDGRTRTFILHVPTRYNGTKPVPLVLALHGRLGDGAGQEKLTHMDDTSEKHGFLVAYPDGIDRSWADGRDATPAEKKGVDDVKFLSALIDHIEQEYKIDPQRVFATGMSNGGFMSGRLACDLSDRIAAVAIVAASLSSNLAASCHPSQPISVLILQGTNDPIVSFSGGPLGTNGQRGEVLSHQAAVQKWSELNGCKQTRTVPNSATDDDQSGAKVADGVIHTACLAGVEVGDYVVQNGGHTWPGGKQYAPEVMIGKTARDVDASELIWQFFATHHR